MYAETASRIRPAALAASFVSHPLTSSVPVLLSLMPDGQHNDHRRTGHLVLHDEAAAAEGHDKLSAQRSSSRGAPEEKWRRRQRLRDGCLDHLQCTVRILKVL